MSLWTAESLPALKVIGVRDNLGQSRNKVWYWAELLL